MQKKINKFLNNYSNFIPPKIFILLIFTVFTIFISLIFFRIDNDFWFLINTGKHILNNGFPLIEPFTIHANLAFIAQQWLTDIIFYLIYDNFGVYGMFIFISLSNILIIILIYKLSMLVSENKVKISIVITLIINLLLNISFVTTRPQIFDIILLLLEVYLLELYVKRNNKLYLIGLPIISVLMINLHSSLWIMIFVFLIPYYIERILKLSKTSYKLKPLIITTIIMLLLGIINPYGIDAIKYLFGSYGIDEINSMVGEMHPVVISSGLAIFVVIFIGLLSYYYNKGNNKLRYLLLFLGTCYLGLSHYKGLIFFLICTILSYSHNFKNLFQEKSTPKTWYQEKIMNVFLIIIFLIALTLYGYTLSNIKLEKKSQTHLYEVANYLENNVDKDIKLYTGYNDGPYLEYRGYKCYLDTRAEVFLKSNNKKEDILMEYYKLQTGKLNYKEFLNKYNFDYLVVSEQDILYYNLEEDKYKIVYQQAIKHYIYDEETINYRIYKKKDNQL